MTAKFCTCLFKERPARSCEFWIPAPGHGFEGTCAADDWDIVQCFLKHYGETLKEDGGIRLMDSMVHLVLDNDDFEDEGRYDLAPGRRVKVFGTKERPIL